MRQLGLLLLLILVESCVAKNYCGKTKKACKKLGGQCESKGGVCDGGEMLPGKKYCQKHKKCDCCVLPPDCSEGTLPPCLALNGKCIGQEEECDGRVVIQKAFCKSDNCKCCFPRDCDTCTGEFFWVESECFMVVTEPKSWAEARSYCQDKGGDLAKPSNQNALTNYLIEKGIDLGDQWWDGFWLGGSDTVSEDHHWLWLDGTSIKMTEGWVSGEPANSPGVNCLIFGAWLAPNGFYDNTCSWKYRFICER